MRDHFFTAALAVGIFCILTPYAFGQNIRKSVSAREVNGTYRMNFRGKFKSSSNEAKVLALGGGKIRFALDLVYPYTMRNGETMVNMGGLDGEADIKGDTAVYTSEDGGCVITFVFVRPGTLRLSEDTEKDRCGFGHNVSANGTYRKVSARKPSFEEQ